jgi:predicted RecA/RadA family phage recombinase
MGLGTAAPSRIRNGMEIGHPARYHEPLELARGRRYDRALEVYEDFLQSSSGTLVAPFATQDTSAAGTPTLDFVDDADNGVFRLAHDAQDEAQNITLYWGDSLHIDATDGPVIEVGLTLTTALTADQRVVVGLASARNATLDDIAAHAWFRLEGANLNITVESDDGTTDTDDQDTGIDWVSGTSMIFRIDMRVLGQIVYYVDGIARSTTAAALMTGNLQPFIEMQKDAGVDANQLDIDYVHVAWAR